MKSPVCKEVGVRSKWATKVRKGLVSLRVAAQVREPRDAKRIMGEVEEPDQLVVDRAATLIHSNLV
ncbi:MAG: hypothetical protein JWR34_866 [Mycobacterium sp.]|nr:hypothetical protein [Mycobacterium sp.]